MKRIATCGLLGWAVLWAALPAFACLAMPANPHSCCRAMQTMECGASASATAPACCRVAPVTPSDIPVGLSFADRSQDVLVGPAAVLPRFETGISGNMQIALASPPPKASSGTSSILRI